MRPVHAVDCGFQRNYRWECWVLPLPSFLVICPAGSVGQVLRPRRLVQYVVADTRSCVKGPTPFPSSQHPCSAASSVACYAVYPMLKLPTAQIPALRRVWSYLRQKSVGRYRSSWYTELSCWNVWVEGL